MTRPDLERESDLAPGAVVGFVFELERETMVRAMRAELVPRSAVAESELEGLWALKVTCDGVEHLTAEAPLSSVCSGWAPPLMIRVGASQLLWLMVENRSEHSCRLRVRLVE